MITQSIFAGTEAKNIPYAPPDIVRACAKPDSAMGPKIIPSIIALKEKSNLFKKKPTMANRSIIPTSNILLFMAYEPTTENTLIAAISIGAGIRAILAK